MKEKPNINWVRLGLWIVMLLTLASSMSHLAAAFGSLEDPGNEWRGWLPAIAIDAGLLAATYAIQQRKVANRRARLLWLGVTLFVVISSFANIDHAMTVAATTNKVLLATFQNLDGWQLAKVILLAGLLPVLVFLVAEVTSDTATNKPQPGTKLATTQPEIGDNLPTDELPIVTIERPTTDNPKLPIPQPTTHNLATRDDDNPQPPELTIPIADWLRGLAPNNPAVVAELSKPQPPTEKITAEITTTELPISQPQLGDRIDNLAKDILDTLQESGVVKLPSRQPAISQPQPDKPRVAKARAPRQLDEELRQAVLLYKQHGSFAKASAVAGVSGETIRKRVAAAREQAPEWVAQQLDN